MVMAKKDPALLVAAEDSLLAKRPGDAELKSALVTAHLNLAKTSIGAEFEYKKVLKLDPKNTVARYELAMIDGHRLLQKNYKNAQWEALVCFGQAATAIDTAGEPHYWMAKCYEKKDDSDFELALESYDKALQRTLSDTLRQRVEAERSVLLRRKKTFEDFWK